MNCILLGGEGANKNHDEERDVLKCLSREKLKPISISANLHRYRVYMKNDVYDRQNTGDLTNSQPFHKCVLNFNVIFLSLVLIF